MNNIFVTEPKGLSSKVLEKSVQRLLCQFPTARKVLVVPPDFTRCYSGAGRLTRLIYERLTAAGTQVQVMPALGTHMPMSQEEQKVFFEGAVPPQAVLEHHWQKDTLTLGVVPKEFVSQISGGLYAQEIEVELNHLLLDGGYDLILSIGQVVPHEVVGMANYSKNLFVGLGGREMINKSHMLGAICGIEQTLGVTDSPVRKLYDYAQQHFLDGKLPIVFVHTVTTRHDDEVKINGLYISEGREAFERAASLSQALNIVHLSRPVKKMVAYLNPEEMKTTWVGNKAVYRTRMAIQDGGELLVLAPGVCAFGENEEMDRMTRQYGYTGREHIMKLFHQGVFEGRTMSAAHLIHGSSDGRFTITYATFPEKLSRQEIEKVGYQWADYTRTAERYNPKTMREGWNTFSDGEEIYYVGTPALGLWKCDDFGEEDGEK